MDLIEQILASTDSKKIKAFFAFTVRDDKEVILEKYRLWTRKFFPGYFSSDDADFHEEIDKYNLMAYTGEISQFVNIAFRGAAKTARTKLFIAFCIANDQEHYRKYIKVLSEDGINATQITTDVYNMLVKPSVNRIYPEIWQKTGTKREETMASFTTSTGIKMLARTIIEDKRGGLQEESRPDFIWFEDFENRLTLMSRAKTRTRFINMEESRTSLAKGGSSIYTCNYISEQGNVHRLVKEKIGPHKVVFIQPILDSKGNPSWDRYTKAEIAHMKATDEDFEGERLCKPSASKDLFFDRSKLESMEKLEPIREVGEFKIYKKYDASHRYAGGHDIGGGVGLDHSASVFIDFDTIPAQVVATFMDNTVKPESFGWEILKQSDKFGGCLVAPERNYGAEAILILKQNGANIFRMPDKDTKVENKDEPSGEYGWHTNGLTKGKMLNALDKAIEDGLLALNDPVLIEEAKSYTRNDLIETVNDPREVTNHFDMLMACAIAWQMMPYAVVAEEKEEYEDEPEDITYPEIFGGRR